MAFIGGSITEMEGYRPMVCGILKRRFPNTEFVFTAAGIAFTCSTTGAFRLQSDVLSKGPVDLFFIEFAVNDDQDAHHARRECILRLEGILRQARRHNAKMDIVITYFVNPGMMDAYRAGHVPLSIASHEEVARHYGVSTIHLAKEVTERVAAGELTWEKFGGVHPAPFGNAICAGMIDELMSRASSTASTCTCPMRSRTRAFIGPSKAYRYPGEIDGKRWDKAQLEAALKPVVEFQRKYGVHIYIGEFSAIRWAPDGSACRYLKDLIDIFEAHDWDWSYHAFREWDGWSVEHGSDPKDHSRAQVAHRPRATAAVVVCAEPEAHGEVGRHVACRDVPDGRPAAKYRLDAQDHGVVLRHGDGPGRATSSGRATCGCSRRTAPTTCTTTPRDPRAGWPPWPRART